MWMGKVRPVSLGANRHFMNEKASSESGPTARGQLKDNIDESSFRKKLGCGLQRGHSMTDEHRMQVATSLIAALRAGDATRFRAIMTDDFVWTLPGTNWCLVLPAWNEF
jgi:hypothetical protein